MRTIEIRRLTGQSSTATTHAVEQAERIVREAQQAGSLVLDATETELRRIDRIEEQTQKVLILPPIAGG